MKRLFDILFSCLGLIFLSPFLFLIALFIKIENPRSRIFYHQHRVGREGEIFPIHKFRTMDPDAESSGLITIGDHDPRVTKAGAFLRKFKLDELPQLFNILKGEMSVVGPRPEVPKYVELYNDRQKRVLMVRPGLTDYASLKYSHENELLARYDDPEKVYREIFLPKKLELNLKYIEEQNFWVDLKIIARTFGKVVSS